VVVNILCPPVAIRQQLGFFFPQRDKMLRKVIFQLNEFAPTAQKTTFKKVAQLEMGMGT